MCGSRTVCDESSSDRPESAMKMTTYKNYQWALAGLLAGSAQAALYTNFHGYTVNNNALVHDQSDFDETQNGTFSSAGISESEYAWFDSRDAYGLAEARIHASTSSVNLRTAVTVEGATTGAIPPPPAGPGGSINSGVQVGGTAGALADVPWRPEDPSGFAGEDFFARFDYSYHGFLDVANTAPGADAGWNRAEANLYFTIYNSTSGEVPPVANFFATLNLTSASGTVWTSDLNVYDEFGGVISMANLSLMNHGNNRFEMTVDGDVSLLLSNLDDMRIEFGFDVLAAAADTTATHRAEFENTASYSLTALNPGAGFSFVPEPGTGLLCGLGVLLCGWRKRVV